MADIQRKTTNLSADNMEQVQEKASLQMTEYQRVCKKLAEKRMVLSEYSKEIGSADDRQLIILVSQFCGDSQGERKKVCLLFCCYAFGYLFVVLFI